MSDMTPEELIEALKDAGWKQQPSYLNKLEIVCMVKDVRTNANDEWTIFINLDGSNIDSAYENAEPHLKAHRADKALEKIKNQNPGRKASSEYLDGYFDALVSMETILKGES